MEGEAKSDSVGELPVAPSSRYYTSGTRRGEGREVRLHMIQLLLCFHTNRSDRRRGGKKEKGKGEKEKGRRAGIDLPTVAPAREKRKGEKKGGEKEHTFYVVLKWGETKKTPGLGSVLRWRTISPRERGKGRKKGERMRVNCGSREEKKEQARAASVCGAGGRRKKGGEEKRGAILLPIIPRR